MAKIKTKQIKTNWRKDWPWFPDHPKKRKIIWIVTYWLLRPDEDDQEEDPLLTKPLQALFDWAEEIATSSQIFDYGLRLKVVSKSVNVEKTKREFTYAFIKPRDLKKYIAHHQILTLLPDFHIRFIDTEELDDRFLADFVPYVEWCKENPWINFDSRQALYQWGITGLRTLKLADLITSLLKKFYENTLSPNEINLINHRANKARIVTGEIDSLQTKLLWDKVQELGGYVGSHTPDPKKYEYNFPKYNFPKNISLTELRKLKNNEKINSSLEEDCIVIRDVETLLFLELKDLVEMYDDRRCKNTECKLPLPLLANGVRYKGKFCNPSSPNYTNCVKSRNRQRKFQQKLLTITT